MAPDGLVVGRDTLVDHAWRALSTSASVLLEGPPGIGKTVVWHETVARARSDGWLVLSAAPTESEAGLPLAALADVLRPLEAHVAGLPAPQRQAVEAVLLSGETSEVVDERALAAATRTLLETAASAGPALVAVDDAPWLDPPSERALRFALRRAPGIVTLAACRTPAAASAPTPVPVPVPLGLDRDPVGRPLTRIVVEPLGVGPLHRVLRDRLDATMSRPLLTRVVGEAGGNPLLAIELSRAIMRLPRHPLPDDDLPVAASMNEVLAGALAALPPASRDAARLAALLTVPALRDLTAAGVRLEDLDAAEEAGVLSVTTAAVEFAHPMYASVVRSEIPAGLRRRLHERLAGVVGEPDERARHLARCVVDADASVAEELTLAAGRLRARGAPELAAAMYERAAELTPEPETARAQERRLEALRCQRDCGDYPAASAGALALAGDSSGELQAEALLVGAAVAWSAEDGLASPLDLAEQALAAVPSGTRVAGRIHAHLSMFHDQPEAGRRHAEAACAALAGSDADQDLLSASLLQLFWHEVRSGETVRTTLLDQALELEDGDPSWLSGTVPAIWWKGIDDHGRARDRLVGMLSRAAAGGDEPQQLELLSHLGEGELQAGRWLAAQEYITAAHDLGEQLGTGLVGESWLMGMLAAHRGQLREAAASAEAGLRRADETDDRWCRRINLHLAAFVALCDGRAAEAADRYRQLADHMDTRGLREPMSQRIEPDWIEACVGAGDLDTGYAVLDRLAVRHERLRRPWTTLGLARSRALLSGAAGDDPAEALAELATARESVPVDVLPLDRARCLLVAGVVHRRARHKREARNALSAAAEEFAALGAAAFERRARAEAERIGGRKPATSSTALTATEERIARLAAGGMTNRLIAEAMFVSPKTVEANLARAYHKLGISSRAELGAVMARTRPAKG